MGAQYQVQYLSSVTKAWRREQQATAVPFHFVVFAFIAILVVGAVYMTVGDANLAASIKIDEPPMTVAEVIKGISHTLSQLIVAWKF